MIYSTCAPANNQHVYCHQAGAPRKERPTSTLTFPLGPYSPALTQPLAIALELRGEKVMGAQPTVAGYCRRGIERLAAGRSFEDALALVERTCANAGTANRIALCQAIEAATGVTPPLRARLTRVLFAEMERVLARLWVLGTSARAANQSRLFAEALEQRETLFAALVAATGERMFWGIAEPGGARDDLEIEALSSAVKQIEVGLSAWRVAAGARGPLGQAGAGIGMIAPGQSEAFSGLAATGSEAATEDPRREHPEGGYADLRDAISWPSESSGQGSDVAARLRRAVDDLAASLAIINAATTASVDAPSATHTTMPATAKTAGAEGSAHVEGPHGPIAIAVTLARAGDLAAMRIEPPGQALLATLPEILTGSHLGQVPLILASLDLCVECLDL
jgi:Ni,Fe-hydrogenase III large subunit